MSAFCSPGLPRSTIWIVSIALATLASLGLHPARRDGHDDRPNRVRHYPTSHASGDDADASASLEDRSAESPPAAAIRRETIDRLRRLIDTLPPDAAALIRATYFEGLTLKEAGERIGIGKAWASRLHARTLDRLRRALRQLDLTDS